MMLFMIGLNMLMQHFFFGKKTDNADMSEFVRNPNATFPLEKRDIDSACSRGSFTSDNGESCRNACMPVYYECCDPFNEFDIYETYNTIAPSDKLTSGDDNTTDQYPGGLDESDFNNRMNGTYPTTRSDSPTSNPRLPSDSPTAGATSVSTFQKTSTRIRHFLRESANYRYHDENDTTESDRELLDGIAIPITVAPVWWNDHKDKLDEHMKSRENLTCTLDNELSGCMRYSKCQAITGKVDPAPAVLSRMCSFVELEKDPQACQSVCAVAACCYATDSTNCIAKKFDMCLDYAPCQNLVSLSDDSDAIIETAPDSLDHDCFYQQQGCLDSCAAAECCSDRSSSCFDLNFIACLTYAPCNNITRTHIHVPKQFNTLDPPPDKILKACDADNSESVMEPSDETCTEICNAGANCCWDYEHQADNCFFDDPLGCMVWKSQCQVLLDNPGL
jgi:hypothetical protein